MCNLNDMGYANEMVSDDESRVNVLYDRMLA